MPLNNARGVPVGVSGTPFASIRLAVQTGKRRMNLGIKRERDETAKPEADVSGETLGTLLNMAGRQRMLSQRIALQAMLAFQQFEGAHAVAREALRVFSESHATLLHGRNGLPGLFSTAIREAFYGSGNVATKIDGFINRAASVLDAIDYRSSQAEAALHELIGMVDPLLNHLHQVTSVYEQESRRIALAQRKGQQELIDRIKAIAKEAHIVSFNGQIVASRAGIAGREFAVVAGVMTNITREMENVVSVFAKRTSLA
ncbi:hypothetical protein P3T23_008226 [Paraburkholderia sp. GAS448]|uniref:type IV pili methyl-accepting chemotaxis transducer N-terminal domain-containing protein n=1 Tax=Paraburkholderia sp. GAS448 TaxID=3035136 RepID=UPI003D262D84